MIEHWKSYLTSRGARTDAVGVTDFGQPQEELESAAHGDVLCELSHLGAVRVSGPDAAQFLQAQLSNDVDAVSAGRSQLSAWCSPKGRMLAVVRVVRVGDDYLLLLPQAILEATLRRLRLFVLRARVELEPTDAELVHIGVCGERAETRLRTALGAAPATVDDVLAAAVAHAVRVAGSRPRFQLTVVAAQAAPLWEALQENTRATGYRCWRWLDIAAGLPVVLPPTLDKLIPQSANLDLVGGLSFTKGCYPGQEVIARIRYRGGLKSRMVLAHADADSAPTPGDTVYAPSLGDQRGGTVVDAERAPQGGWDLLCVVPLADAGAGGLRLGDAAGTPLRLRELPYAGVADQGRAR